MHRLASSARSPWAQLIAAAALWIALYAVLPAFASFTTHTLLGIQPGSHLGEAVEFFLYDTPKVILLLVAVVFGVGILRTFITPERTRAILAGKKESVGNVLAALLGVATPFCTCSAIPLFIGFVSAGVPLGMTFSFLIASPMVNEVALVLLVGLFGWKVALLYIGTGLGIAIVAGWVLGRMRLERFIEPWVLALAASTAQRPASAAHPSWKQRIAAGREAVRDVVGKVWPFLVLGIAIGAAIHGWVPTDALAQIMGRGAWWSVPLAVLLGVPMYANAAGILPIVQALIEKGAALGTALAFMMAVIGLSLPEAIILRKVLRPQLIAAFFGIVATGILLVGYLFNALL